MRKALLGLVGLQLVAQAFQLATGLVVVQSLSVADYAIYTLFGSALSLLTLAADPGITQLFVSVVAKMRMQPERGRALGATLLRTSFTWLAIAFVPVLAYFFSGARIPPDLLRAMAVLLAAQSALAAVERFVIARWNAAQQLREFGLLQVLGAGTRLLFVAIALTLMPSWQWGVASLLAGSAATLALTLALDRRKLFFSLQGVDSATVREDKLRVLALLWPLLPSSAYSLMAGQLPVLLAARTADLQAIGEFGAISRLGQVIMMLGLLNSNVLNAHLASRHDRPAYGARLLLLMCAAYAGASLIMGLLTLAWPGMWSYVIGRQYAPLVAEPLWMIAICAMNLIQGAMYFASLSFERTRHQWLHIPAGAAAAGAYVAMHGLRVSTARDMLELAFCLAVTAAAVQCAVVAAALAARAKA